MMKAMPSCHNNRRGTQRRGSTLAAVVVTVVIIAALAAVALPVLQGAQTLDDANRTAVMLVSLDTSLTSNGLGLLKGICNTTAHCPFFLNSLVFQITNGMATCRTGTNYGAADVTSWQTGAPYTGYPILPGKGLRTPLGWVHDTLIKLANNSFEVHIDSLTLDQANYLDLAIDGSATPTTLKLRYAEQAAIFTATGQHRYLARYIPTPTGRINC